MPLAPSLSRGEERGRDVKPFFVHLLRCRDRSYYVGHTDDLEKRMAEHNHGTIGGYTSTRRPVELVWSLDLATRDQAFDLEMQIKRWSRAKKEALIREDWAALVRLSGPRSGPDLRRTLLLRQAEHVSAESAASPARASTGSARAGLWERVESRTASGGCGGELPSGTSPQGPMDSDSGNA
jgi:putative endonuclease